MWNASHFAVFLSEKELQFENEENLMSEKLNNAESTDEIRLTVAGLLKNYLTGPLPEPRPGQTIQTLIEELGLPSDLVAFVLVNGRQQPKSYVLQKGDEVKLAPLVGGGNRKVHDKFMKEVIKWNTRHA